PTHCYTLSLHDALPIYNGRHSNTKVTVELDRSQSTTDLECSRLGDASAGYLHRISGIEFPRRLLHDPRKLQSCLAVVPSVVYRSQSHHNDLLQLNSFITNTAVVPD